MATISSNGEIQIEQSGSYLTQYYRGGATFQAYTSYNTPSAPTTANGSRASFTIVGGMDFNNGAANSQHFRVPSMSFFTGAPSNAGTGISNQPCILLGFRSQSVTTSPGTLNSGLGTFTVPDSTSTTSSGPSSIPVMSFGGTPATWMQITDRNLPPSYGSQAWISSGGQFTINRYGTASGAPSNGTALQITGPSTGLAPAGSATLYVNSVVAAPLTNAYQTNYGFNGTTVGSVTSTPTTTSFNTSSDYRLKKDISPIENPKSLLESLKPRTWKWKINDEPGIGFIAHELQEDFIDADKVGLVSGVKDGVAKYGKLVDADGNFKGWTSPETGEFYPEYIVEPSTQEEVDKWAEKGYTWVEEPSQNKPTYQSIDQSFLIAPLVSAVKELYNYIESIQDRMSQVESRIASLENN